MARRRPQVLLERIYQLVNHVLDECLLLHSGALLAEHSLLEGEERCLLELLGFERVSGPHVVGITHLNVAMLHAFDLFFKLVEEVLAYCLDLIRLAF